MKAYTDTIVNVWDFLAERFNTHKENNEIHPDAAVNIHIGWPVFFDQIELQRNFLGTKTLDILDFGCGTGRFCKALHKKSYKVSGMDRSNKMVQVSKRNVPNSVALYTEKSFGEAIKSKTIYNKFDVITSMHVFEWNEDIEKIASTLVNLLKKNGIILFAVFPKKHIIDSLEIKDLFEDFDSPDNPTYGYANFDGIKVPVFIRDASFFDNLFNSLNCDKVFEFYPPYTKSFIKDYNWKASLYPEMMILAYRKF